MNKAALNHHLDTIHPELIRMADTIWDYAETAFEEFKSVALLKDVLRAHGFSIEDEAGGIRTAFCATKGTDGPTIGILAEYDALSGMSQKAECTYREELAHGDNGHGCGHNLFAAASVGAAIGAAAFLAENNLPGTIKLFGCPGEEGGSGKAFMARAGAFLGMDAAFAWHPMAVNAVFDMSTLANYQVLYKFTGQAAHAAVAPHKGRSALDAVELMNVGVNFLREHVIQEARIHYAITNGGGFSPNVVQPYADVLYLMRAPLTPQVEEIYRRINKIALGAAMMTETEVEIRFIKACANVVPNKTLSALLYENLTAQELPTYTDDEVRFAQTMAATVPQGESDAHRFLQGNPKDLRQYVDRLAGGPLCDIVLPFSEHTPDKLLAMSSDVGDVSWLVPTAQIATACWCLGTPEHSWHLVAQGRSSVAHKGMLLAAKTLACAAVDAVLRPEVIAKAKKELLERLDGHRYTSAIPPEVQPMPIGKL